MTKRRLKFRYNSILIISSKKAERVILLANLYRYILDWAETLMNSLLGDSVNFAKPAQPKSIKFCRNCHHQLGKERLRKSTKSFQYKNIILIRLLWRSNMTCDNKTCIFWPNLVQKNSPKKRNSRIYDIKESVNFNLGIVNF